jgi:histidine transport system permease protein/arginine/ornithine transport system permease protein
MIAVMVIYLIITGLSDVILRAVDRKYAAGVRKA